MPPRAVPSGAPARAATESIAVMPGTTSRSISRHAGGPASMASQTAAAMAKTPGSPPETTQTRRPATAASRAARVSVNSGEPVRNGSTMASTRVPCAASSSGSCARDPNPKWIAAGSRRVPTGVMGGVS